MRGDVGQQLGPGGRADLVGNHLEHLAFGRQLEHGAGDMPPRAA